MDILDRTQQGATKMMKQLEHVLSEEKPRELGLFSLEKKRPTANLVIVYEYLKGGSKECKVRLISWYLMNREDAIGIKLNTRN